MLPEAQETSGITRQGGCSFRQSEMPSYRTQKGQVAPGEILQHVATAFNSETLQKKGLKTCLATLERIQKISQLSNGPWDY